MSKKLNPKNLLLTDRGKQWLEQFEPEDKVFPMLFLYTLRMITS